MKKHARNEPKIKRNQDNSPLKIHFHILSNIIKFIV